jgi:hypothetical protein
VGKEERGMMMDKERQKLVHRYCQAKKQLSEIEGDLYPLIREICEISTDICYEDRIVDVVIDDEPFMLDEKAVCVRVETGEFGPASYFFPARYLGMTIDEIKKDIAAENQKRKKEIESQELDAERKEYLRLKKKFEG